MNLEEKIKNKYLYSKGFNVLKYLYFFFQSIRKNKHLNISYSGVAAQDLIINNFFKNKNEGVYIDVGCFHPYNGNNTKKLYDKGWSGINIDLDFHTIDLFNFIRKRDENINIAISNIEGEQELYFFHNRSAFNSLDKMKKNKAKEIRKIQTKTLNTVIENSKFKNKKINLISIDVEGHELEVIKSINLTKYTPDMIIVEYMEAISNWKFYKQNINNILESDIYKYLINNDYYFVNWLHCDLVFVHKSIRK
ncbi:FkbM family methyltransferase [bacterium]|nr:FkbM family methyltransferase [bacterium]